MFRTSMHDKKNWIWQLQCCFYFICFSVTFFYYVGFSLLHWLESVNGRSLSSGCLFNERYLVQSRKLPAPCLSWGSRSCRGPAKGLRGGCRSMMQRSTNTEKNSFSYPEKNGHWCWYIVSADWFCCHISWRQTTTLILSERVKVINCAKKKFISINFCYYNPRRESERERHRRLPADFPVKGSTELNFLIDVSFMGCCGNQIL